MLNFIQGSMSFLINLFLATSQTLPQVFLFYELLHTEVCTSAQLQLSNKGGKMSQISCPITHQIHILACLQWVGPECVLFPSEDSPQPLSLELPHAHKGSGGHTHVLKCGQRQNLTEIK